MRPLWSEASYQRSYITFRTVPPPPYPDCLTTTRISSRVADGRYDLTVRTYDVQVIPTHPTLSGDRQPDPNSKPRAIGLSLKPNVSRRPRRRRRRRPNDIGSAPRADHRRPQPFLLPHHR